MVPFLGHPVRYTYVLFANAPVRNNVSMHERHTQVSVPNMFSCISITVEQHAINLCMSATFIGIFKVRNTFAQNSLHFTFSCYAR